MTRLKFIPLLFFILSVKASFAWNDTVWLYTFVGSLENYSEAALRALPLEMIEIRDSNQMVLKRCYLNDSIVEEFFYEKGRKVLALISHQSSYHTKTVYSYNKKGRCIKEETFYFRRWPPVRTDQDSAAYWKKVIEIKYGFDRKGNNTLIVERHASSRHGFKKPASVTRKENSFDNSNRIVQLIEYRGKERYVTTLSRYEYNDSGYTARWYYYGSFTLKKKDLDKEPQLARPKFFFAYTKTFPNKKIEYSTDEYRYSEMTVITVFDEYGRVKTKTRNARGHLYIYENPTNSK